MVRLTTNPDSGQTVPPQPAPTPFTVNPTRPPTTIPLRLRCATAWVTRLTLDDLLPKMASNEWEVRSALTTRTCPAASSGDSNNPVMLNGGWQSGCRSTGWHAEYASRQFRCLVPAPPLLVLSRWTVTLDIGSGKERFTQFAQHLCRERTQSSGYASAADRFQELDKTGVIRRGIQWPNQRY